MICAQLDNILDDPDAISALLTEHLHPLESEKKMHGEVFTPPTLINEMLDGLERVDPNIWTNPRMRILDPAAGFGNFCAIIYGRLMRGLAREIPDAINRKIHILHNMLYMCEINPKNIRLCEQIFHEQHGTNRMHLFAGDFFKLDPTNEWQVSSFDLIIGNPPYNAPHKDKSNGSTLYPKFIEHCALLLAPNGYQVFVHPPMWRKPGHKLHDLMFNRQIHYLEMHDANDGMRTFHASTRYDWYVLQNIASTQSTLTTIQQCDGRIVTIPIMNLPLLPNYGNSIVSKIIRCALRDGSMRVFRGKVSSKHCQEYTIPTKDRRFPIINSLPQNEAIKLYYETSAGAHQFARKVMFSNGGFIVPRYDPGYFDATEQAMIQLVTNADEGAKVCAFLQSHAIQYMLSACIWSSFRNEHNTFNYVPFPHKMFASDSEVYRYLDLTDDEIAIIVSWASNRAESDRANIVQLCDPTPAIDHVIALQDELRQSSREKIEFNKMTVTQLCALAKAAKFRGYSKLKRDELIALLREQN